MVNRVTRGRTREAADAYGCALRVPDRALAVWAHAGLARRVTHRATTRVARRVQPCGRGAGHDDDPRRRQRSPTGREPSGLSPEGGARWGRPRGQHTWGGPHRGSPGVPGTRLGVEDRRAEGPQPTGCARRRATRSRGSGPHPPSAPLHDPEAHHPRRRLAGQPAGSHRGSLALA
jgi:hypothetical protein